MDCLLEFSLLWVIADVLLPLLKMLTAPQNPLHICDSVSGWSQQGEFQVKTFTINILLMFKFESLFGNIVIR